MTTSRRYDVVVVGGGFAGSLLARLLALKGRSVLVLERDRHPRFALGESSTPLGNLALERIALDHGLEDLYSLAAHGRWLRDLPQLPRGLKRGFTFYGHLPEAEALAGRLAVAASPDDFIADCQWDRAALDHAFLERARAAGAEVLEGHELTAIEALNAESRLTATCLPEGSAGGRAGRSLEFRAGFVVDASGAAGAVARRLGVTNLAAPAGYTTELIFGHVEGLPAFEETEGFDCPIYPESFSAVHHMTPDGWMYQLRFDDGRTSIGFLSPCEAGPRLRAHDLATLVARYPALARQFRGLDLGANQDSLNVAGPLQRRLSAARGQGFAVLPHTYVFYGPLFAMGIAWSLLGVERLYDCLMSEGNQRAEELRRYGALLAREADHVERLMRRAWAEFPLSFERFSRVAQAYFVAASYQESRQRLLDEPAAGWAWEGFLGADDEVLSQAFRYLGQESSDLERLASMLDDRNVGGFFDQARSQSQEPVLYPVDLSALERSCQKLGLDPAEYQRRSHRLRSPDLFAEAQESLALESGSLTGNERSRNHQS